MDPDPSLAIPGAQCGSCSDPCKPSCAQADEAPGWHLSLCPLFIPAWKWGCAFLCLPFFPLAGGHTPLLHNQEPALGRARKLDIHISCQALSNRDY